jgi:hypothetical protein
MSKLKNSDAAEKAVRQQAKGAVELRKPGEPGFSPGENQPVLDAEMRPLGDPSRLAEAADVAPCDDAE